MHKRIQNSNHQIEITQVQQQRTSLWDVSFLYTRFASLNSGWLIIIFFLVKRPEAKPTNHSPKSSPTLSKSVLCIIYDLTEVSGHVIRSEKWQYSQHFRFIQVSMGSLLCQSRSYARRTFFPLWPGIASPIPAVLTLCNFTTLLQVLLIQALSIKAKTIKHIC